MMTMAGFRVGRTLLVLIGAGLAVGGFAGTASAQVIVLKSSAPDLRRGTVVANTGRIVVPAGTAVTLALPSGAWRELAGPVDVRVSALTRGVQPNPAVFDAIRQFAESQGGRRFASVRSATRSGGSGDAGANQARFSWRDIPIGTHGDYCVEKGAALSLVRSTAGKAQPLTVVNMNSASRARIQFAAEDTRIPWPSDLTPENGSFAILAPRKRMRQLRLRLITPLPAPEQTLRVLHGQRCRVQFQAYLRSVMVAQR
jgi:hypothetical protein